MSIAAGEGSMYKDELEKLDRAGSPPQMQRWNRRTKTALFVVTGILALVGIAIGLLVLLKRD